MRFFGGGGFSGGTVPGDTTFSGNVLISGTLEVTGAVTFTTTVTGSGNIMAGAAFAVGFTGRSQIRSSADAVMEFRNAANSAGSRLVVSVEGTAAAPGVQLATAAGIRANQGSGRSYISYNSSDQVGFGNTANINTPSGGIYGWASTTIDTAIDTRLYRASAGVAAVAGAGVGVVTGAAGFQPAQSDNGATIQILAVSELLTLNTGGTTTDTTANLLLANSFVLTVVARITTTITTAANWQVGDPTTAGRFNAANSTLTAGTVSVGRVHATTGIASATTGIWQAADAKVRITTNANPGAGAIRLTTFYMLFTPPTS